ncbi:MAG: hypothetical protein H6740_00495 [Alphaproteobacteria bacterium]|nr:hypothetical protein [Alphaproteobacteria bacterium]
MPLLLLIAACTLRPTPEGPSPAQLRARTPDTQWYPGDHGAAQVAALVHAGSAYDPVGFEGLSYRAAQALLHEPALQREDLQLSVEVGREWVWLEVRGPPGAAPEALALLAEALTWGAPSEAALALAAADAEAELAAIEADAGRLAAEVLELRIYEGHPYGHAIAGRRGVAELLTAEQVGAHRARTWVRESVHVAAWGDVNPDLLPDFERALRPLPSTRAPQPLPTTWPRLAGRSLLVVESELPLAGIAVGQPIVYRPGALDLSALERSATHFELGEGQLRTSAQPFDRHTQPTLTLSLPAMPASLSEETLREAFARWEAWYAAPPEGLSCEISSRELAIRGLLEAATPPPARSAFEVLPAPDQAFVVVVTDEADALISALGEDGREENGEAPVKAPDTPGLAPLSFSQMTRIPQEGLLR